MRRVFVLLIVLVLVCMPVALAQEAGFEEKDASSKSALLMDTGSRQILYERDIHEKVYPASVTKVMTMLLALEALEEGRVSLGEKVPVSERAASMGGSQIFLSPGDKITFAEMMIGIGVGSANDGAVAMAEFLAGTVEDFVLQMNTRAEELGMKNTKFVNPHGLHDENHYTTAYDVALMSLELLQHPQIHDWITIWMEEEFLKGKIKKEEGVYLSNANKLVRYYEGGDGLKTGFTNEAGNCISATAKRGETRMLAVVMGAQGRQDLFDEARGLLDWGFANFTSFSVAAKGDIIADRAVEKGVTSKVSLQAARDFYLLLKKEQAKKAKEFTREVVLPHSFNAPLHEGQKAGYLKITDIDGEELGRVPLVVAKDIPRANLWQIFRRVSVSWLLPKN